MMRRIRLPVTVLFCTLLFLSAAFAEETVVRVGWYPIEKLEEHDAEGNPSGFGKDCLIALARFTGFSYQFVDGTFEESLSRLENGDIDMMLFMKYTPERGEVLDYADFPLFKVSSLLTCLKEHSDDYKDISSLNGKTVALEAKAIQTKELESSIEGKGITYVPLICANSTEVKEAVDSGKADYAFLPSVVPLSGKQAVVESIDTRFSTITVSKKRQDILDKLNRGMAALIEDDPAFFENRYKAYFGTSTTNSFFLTKEEKKALKESGTLRVYLDSNDGYLSRYVDGKLVGIRADIVKLIAEKLDVQYELVHLPDPSAALHWQENDAIDLVSGTDFDYNLAREKGYLITSPYFTYKYYAIKHKGNTVSLDNARVAVLDSGSFFTEHYIVPSFRENQLLRQKTKLDCLKMVNSGRADLTYLGSYVAEYYLQGYEYSDVTATITDYQTEKCFALRQDANKDLLSALNKAIGSISETEMQTIILQNTLPNESNMTIRGQINRNPLFFSFLFSSLFVIIMIAITLLLVSRKLAAKNRQLEKANKAKSEFLSRMSHDMRTPLNAVLGFTALATDEKGLPPTVRDYLEKITLSGNYLLSLINDVLDMSRIENGKFVLNEESVDSLAFLAHLGEVFTSEAKAKGITLRTDFSAVTTRWVIMDDVRSRQIYANLLSNAIKFSSIGTTIIWTVNEEKKGNGMVSRTSTITDQGCGMSDDFMKRMFNPFEQESKENALAGTGLGLSIVQRIVIMMGGTITVRSVLAKGTTFTVTLDRKIGEEPEGKTKKHQVKPVSLKGKRILLCEDNEVNTMVATRFLEKTGCETECAVDGEEGVQKFLSSPVGYYSLILMDIRMPRMDGLAATRKIRSMDREDAKTIPIIAMSANAFEEDRKKSLEAGMNDHLSKPFEPENFFKILETYANGK